MQSQHWCPLCEGPCRPGFHLPPIHARYPFMTPEQIAATQPEPEGPPAPADVKRAGRRRRIEDRMRRLQETTAHQPDEDR